MKKKKLQAMLTFAVTYFSIMTFSIYTSGCASTTSSKQILHANDAMMMASLYNNDQKNSYLLDAAQGYLNQDAKQAAQNALQQIHISQLNPQQLLDYQDTQARLLFKEKEYLKVIHLLRQLAVQPNSTLSPAQLTILAQSYAGIGNTLAALKTFNLAIQHTPSTQQKPLIIKFWQYLEEIPLVDLQAFEQKKLLDHDLQSWVALAILNNTSHSAITFSKQLQQWINQYPQSPARQLFNIDNVPANATNMNQHIALMLPMTGPLASSGNAIKNAFIAAYYNYHKQFPNDPVTVQVYDTNQKTMPQLYQQALTAHSSMIVGPLTKSNVLAMSAIKKPAIPILALNDISDNKAPNNMFFYGLSPIADAKQIAHRAWLDNNSPNAMLIIPANSWGQQIGQAFQHQWQQLGGAVLNTSSYNSRQDLYTKVKQNLLLTSSEGRIDTIENTIGKQVRGISRIRHDANMIFIVALPNMARQIMPLLKFYYAQHIPAYAVSTLYNGNNNTAADYDMNGVIFNDMPFVLLKHFPNDYAYNDLRDQFAELYPNSYKNNKKLYAFGLDAFLLTHSLTQLQIAPLLGIYGATGQLYLDNNHHIERRLLWAKMIHGEPHLLNH